MRVLVRQGLLPPQHPRGLLVNLLRRLVGQRATAQFVGGRCTSSTALATAVGLTVPGARVTATRVTAGDPWTTLHVIYRYHHPVAERHLLAVIHHAALAGHRRDEENEVAAAQRIKDAVISAAWAKAQLGLDLEPWQTRVL